MWHPPQTSDNPDDLAAPPYAFTERPTPNSEWVSECDSITIEAGVTQDVLAINVQGYLAILLSVNVGGTENGIAYLKGDKHTRWTLRFAADGANGQSFYTGFPMRSNPSILHVAIENLAAASGTFNASICLWKVPLTKAPPIR